MKLYKSDIDTIIGTLRVAVDEDACVCAVEFLKNGQPKIPIIKKLSNDVVADPGKCKTATTEIIEFLDGKRTSFSVNAKMTGTDFQKKVWDELTQIPYGETISYRELAERIGNPKAIRAVGSANGKNPVSIIVPCHRVIGSDGSLTGFGGGLENKRKLLELERINL